MGFGYHRYPLESIAKLLANARGLNWIGRQIVLREVYHDSYLKSDAESANSPLEIMCVTPTEGLQGMWRYATRIKEFHTYNVAGQFGLSYIEFCNLPHYIAEEIIEVLRKDVAEKRSISETAERRGKEEASRFLPPLPGM